jgi:hypothetical protein
MIAYSQSMVLTSAWHWDMQSHSIAISSKRVGLDTRLDCASQRVKFAGGMDDMER